MEKELQAYRKFPPCAKLVEGVAAGDLPGFKSTPLTQAQLADATMLYGIWCADLKQYALRVISARGKSPAVNALTQTCEMSLGEPKKVGELLDRMILDFRAVQRAKVMIENDIRRARKMPLRDPSLPELDYVSDIDNLLKKRKLFVLSPGTRQLIIRCAIIIVIVLLLIATFFVLKRERMYGPSDILVDRGALVGIATACRPTPASYRRWY